MDKIWHYYLDYGRMGYIEGMFVATEKEIQNKIGSTIRFGEVLGEHSEVTSYLDWDDLEELTDDEELIKECIKFNIVPNGYNPLDYIYIEEDEEDEEYDEDSY